MTQKEIFKYWMESSDDDFRTMEHLLESGDYSWALFLGHLVIEKLLKACFVKTAGADAPLSHNLNLLAQKAGLALSEEQTDLCADINTFNINARYEDYKREFKAKCTREYALLYAGRIKELRTWIKRKLEEQP